MKPIATLRKHQTGAVAIMVGLTIVVLVAFLGMTVDMGRLFITKTELSNAADACSLAAAAELDGASDSLDRAVSAGTTIGQRNKVGFQGSAITIFPADITFSDHLNGVYLDKTAATPANMKYAKCTLPQTGIVPYFMQVMGFGPQTVTSHAVATLSPGITNCGLPIGICQNKAPPSTCSDGSAPDAMGLCKKQWYCSKFTVGGNSTPCPGFGSTGNFNWIDFNPGAPTAGCSGGGASELACIITGSGQCNLNITNCVGQTGGISSLDKAWNTRFGLYKGSDNVSNAPPDFSGFAYTPTSWPSQYNAFAGTSGTTPHLASLPGDTAATSARKANLPYQGDTQAGFSPPGTNGYSNSSASQLATAGSDRRVVVVPVVDCDTWGASPPPSTCPSQQTKILKFACIAMLHPMTTPQDPNYLEYLGLSDAPGSPCATTGLPGGPGSVGPRVPALVR